MVVNFDIKCPYCSTNLGGTEFPQKCGNCKRRFRLDYCPSCGAKFGGKELPQVCSNCGKYLTILDIFFKDDVNQAFKTILSYFSLLPEIYDSDYSKYYSKIYENNWDKGLEAMHQNIMQNLIPKKVDIEQFIKALIEKGFLYITEGGWSQSGKTHWSDEVHIRENIIDLLEVLNQKLINDLYEDISKILEEKENIIILKMIQKGVPSDVLKKLYFKKVDDLVNTGFTNGLKLIGFSNNTLIGKKFKEILEKKTSIAFIRKEMETRFSNLSIDEKVILYFLDLNETVIGRDYGHFKSVSNSTYKRYENSHDSIIVNFDEKLNIIALITKTDVITIKKIIEQLKERGLIWEEDVFVYTDVVYKKVIKIFPSVPEGFFEDYFSNIPEDIIKLLDLWYKEHKEIGMFFLENIINSVKDSEHWIVPDEITDFLNEFLGDKLPKQVNFLYAKLGSKIYVVPFWHNLTLERIYDKKKEVLHNYLNQILHQITTYYKNDIGTDISQQNESGIGWININSIKSNFKIIVAPYIVFNNLVLIRKLLEMSNGLFIILTHQNYPTYKGVLERSFNTEEINQIYSIFSRNKKLEVFPEKLLPSELNFILKINIEPLEQNIVENKSINAISSVQDIKIPPEISETQGKINDLDILRGGKENQNYIKIYSTFEVAGDCFKFFIKIANLFTELAINNTLVKISLPNTLKLDKKTPSNVYHIGEIQPQKFGTAIFYLFCETCADTEINAYIEFKDPKGNIQVKIMDPYQIKSCKYVQPRKISLQELNHKFETEEKKSIEIPIKHGVQEHDIIKRIKDRMTMSTISSSYNTLQMFGTAKDKSDIGFKSLLKEINGVQTYTATVFGLNQSVIIGILSEIIEALRDIKVDTEVIKKDTKEIIEELSTIINNQIAIYEKISEEIESTKNVITDIRKKISDLEDIGKFELIGELDNKISELRQELKNLFYRREENINLIVENTEKVLQNQEITDSYIRDKFDEVEKYLKTHLDSDWEKIRDKWEDYKKGKINKRELLASGLKALSKKFIQLFIKFKL